MMRPDVPRSESELLELVSQGEQRDVEFKEGVPNAQVEWKIVVAVAAMANLPDGGLVVLGVEDRTGRLVGLPPENLRVWSNRDDVRRKVNYYLAPSVDLDAHQVGSCVVLEVRPFLRTPVVAQSDKGEIREGALYYRSSHVASSAQISRLEDWNELFETLLGRVQANARRIDGRQERIREQAAEEAIRDRMNTASKAVIPPRLLESPPTPNLIRAVEENFRLFQLRSKQSEVKANLKAAFVSLKAYRMEKDTYPRRLALAGFSPEPGGNYVYRAVEGEIVGAEQRRDRAELVADGMSLLASYDARPYIGDSSFLVMAVTRFYPEGLLDVWFIDRFGEPRCLTPETTSKEDRRRKAQWDALASSVFAPAEAV